MLEGGIQTDVSTAALESYHQLHLIMYITSLRWIGKCSCIVYDLDIFLEEKWQFIVGIMTHFNRMIGIVTASTINPAERK